MDLAQARHQVERRKGERRKKKTFLFYPERRSGFDRRRPVSKSKIIDSYEMVLHFLKDNSQILLVKLVLLNILNLADYLFTLGWLSLGIKEMNPLMHLMFQSNVYYAGFFKISTGILISLLIWRFRNYRLIIELAITAFLLYLMLYLYHLLGAVFLIT